jgi:hypothetical protein
VSDLEQGEGFAGDGPKAVKLKAHVTIALVDDGSEHGQVACTRRQPVRHSSIFYSILSKKCLAP